MFYNALSPLTDRFRALIERNADSYLMAMFQDEQAYLPERIAFCERYGVDCVYTALEPPYAQRVYGGGGRHVVSYIPGHVSDQLQAASRRLGAVGDRPIDVGYRGRKLPPEWGASGREKYEIGVRFRKRAGGLGLRLDIELDEDKRLYGRAWYRFIGSCKAMLGTESGLEVLPWLVRRPAGERDAAELRPYMAEPVPDGWEAIPYRTIASRHFEAAALGTCQILYEGSYSGAMQPMVHYIPLKKDFSNFDDVIDHYRDAPLRLQLTASAQRDLIDGNRYTYAEFIARFDQELEQAGAAPRPRRGEHKRVARQIVRPRVRRAAQVVSITARDYAWLAKQGLG